MQLTPEQIKNLRTLLATKKGTLKRNLSYVQRSLDELLSGQLTKPTHVATDFAASFYKAVDELGLVLNEHGSKEEFLAQRDHSYAVSVTNPPVTFQELMEICDMTDPTGMLRSR